MGAASEGQTRLPFLAVKSQFSQKLILMLCWFIWPQCLHVKSQCHSHLTRQWMTYATVILISSLWWAKLF